MGDIIFIPMVHGGCVGCVCCLFYNKYDRLFRKIGKLLEGWSNGKTRGKKGTVPRALTNSRMDVCKRLT